MPEKTPDQDPDESVEFDPLTNPPPPKMDPKEARILRRRAYMKEYAKNYAKKQKEEGSARKSRNTGRPPGRPPKSAEPAPKSYKPVWAPLYKEDGTPGPQFALLSCPFPEIFFGGARGGGKGSSLDSLVMTPFGWRQMKELQLGQAVCNPDGSVCHIIGIYPLGERQLYRVTFHDDTFTEVTDDHIWLTWKSNKSQKRNGVRQFGQDSARLWTTKAMMEDMKTERNIKQNFLIQITQPVAINDVSRYPRRPIPPYLLGVLLGDGSLSDHAIRYTKPDREIADFINDALEKYGFTQRLTGPYEYEGKCLSWGVSVSADSELIHHLRKLELIGTRSLTKFIPEPYLLGTVEERWELLRGLMDTDGWAEEDGDIYFCTSSHRLRDDTAHLARSLGAVVTVREKEPHYTYKGETLQGQTAWTLRIKLREPSMAFHLERKKARCQRSPQSMFRMVVSIEPSRISESQCIRVSHPNGLYLTNDYIVTHNTDGAIGKWLQHASRYGENAKGVFFRRRFKQLEDVQARCAQIFSRINATYNKGDATWVFPNGAVLKLRHLWDIAATEEYHGHSYCVAEGTPILMADGSYRPIETIQVDDLVMTLEGPKPVTATMAPGLKPCVRVEVFDSSGEKLGEQIHPEDHPVLTSVSLLPEGRSSTYPTSPLPWDNRAPGSTAGLRPSYSPDFVSQESLSCLLSPIDEGYGRSFPGLSRSASRRREYPSQWQSYTTLLCAHRESQVLSAYPEDGRSGCKASENESPESLPLPRLSCPVVLHGPDHLSGPLYQRVSNLCRTSDKFSVLSDLTGQETTSLSLDPLPPFGQDQRLLRYSMQHPDSDDAACDLLELQTATSCQDRYLSDHRLRDEQLLDLSGSDPVVFPLQDGAATHSRMDSNLDEGEHIPGYTRHHFSSYIHPYTGKHRRVDQPYRFGCAVFQPCEPHCVYDLSILDANHYITKNNLINVNSFLCFEEVTNWSTPDAINRLRGTLRSSAGVMPELIMTGNPGGSGHCVPFGDVLTPSGWIDIEDLRAGDPVITVTPCGEMVETVAGQIHRSRYAGPMVFLSQDGVSIICTPNHGIGVIGAGEAGEIVLKPLIDLSGGFSIPRAVSYQGAVFRLDQHLRSELDMSDCSCEIHHYDGEVYCIGVPDTHSFIIQQNGSIWISGNSWVKARYISPAPQGWTPIRDEETGELRIYIPSRLTDNSAMMKNDPTYANRLRGTGSASLVNAWLNGDWDIVAGGFFDDLIVPSRHFLQPFAIPPGWGWRRSFDWGSAAPAYLAIWAVSDGNPVPELDGFVFPRGSLILVKEWYTCAKTKAGDIIPNDGLRLTNLALGQGIAERSLGHRFSGCVADPSIYSKLGRESIYDEMRKGAKEAGHNLIMSPADNNRVGGWQKMRDMLESAGQDRPERPGLWVFETCAHWLRTVPVMQRSDTDFDDVDTTQEDHCLHGDTLVETRDGHIPIRNLVGKVGEARQANGSYMCFFGCRLTRKGADTITLTTKDGRSLICTPDHFILTLKGWMHAIYTLGETIVCVQPPDPDSSGGKGAKVTSIVHGGVDDVFNLEVEHTHAFAVNGGLIVHNCADATRYACMTGTRTLKVGDLIGR